MLGNFIGGGQVFLHKARMFSQIFARTVKLALILGILISALIYKDKVLAFNWYDSLLYQKALIASYFDRNINELRSSFGIEANYTTYIGARDRNKSNLLPNTVLNTRYLESAYMDAQQLILEIILLIIFSSSAVFIIIFILWNKFGRELKRSKVQQGSDVVLSDVEVSKSLKRLAKASDLVIGQMALVRDMETRHLLVTGCTGSGKSNLFHNILPQLIKKKQPAIIIDQTGEMIAKYYDSSRGDIIFNPFDARSKTWNFWRDIDSIEAIERFSKILFGFRRKAKIDPFWSQASEMVFNSCAAIERARSGSVENLAHILMNYSVEQLASLLRGTSGGSYFAEDNKVTANSIRSNLANDSRPMSYLRDKEEGNTFSLKEYFQGVEQGSGACLFLSTKASNRELTMPLIACLTELAMKELIDLGINQERRVWFVIDELASLGTLPALSTLTAEGRKYGACVIAGLQSLNQIYDNYGHYAGSSIFGQFGTSFFFRNNEASIAQMISSMCGMETITKQQENTSFGANEYRDGVSYNEHQQRKRLVEYSDLAGLATGECYVLLPEPEVRLSKMQTPEIVLEDKHPGFYPAPEYITKSMQYISCKPKSRNKRKGQSSAL